MFESIFKNGTNVEALLLMGGIVLIIGFIYSLIASLRLRTSKSFFITTSLMPFIVSLVISMMGMFLSGATSTTARIVTIAVALGLIRFRSVNAKAEEILILFGAIATGLVSGLGYVAYAALFALVIATMYVLLSFLPLFNGKVFSKEKILKITIPESLDYEKEFKDIFDKSLKKHELVGIKTTGMGSMFKLSYKIILNDQNKEKELIDELRVKNGNLEISIIPYIEDTKHI